MKKYIFLIFLVTFGLHANAAESNRYIVKLKQHTESQKTKTRKIHKPRGTVVKQLKNGYVIKLDQGVTPDSLYENEEIETIEQDRLLHLIEPSSIQPADVEMFGKENIPHGIKRIHADTGGEYHVSVAIIDTGVDADHHDLNVIKGINFINIGQPQKDDNGHGTHVAGTVAAINNGEGVVGVAPGASIIALKVLDSQGSGWMSDIIAAVDWVTEHADEVDVVNMSLGAFGSSELMHEAIKRSVDKGVVYVVAAGNNSMDIFGYSKDYFTGDNYYPAAYPEVMTISAMADTDGIKGGFGPKSSYGDQDDTLAWFSNYSSAVHPNNPVYSPGAGIDLAAPGVDILSTYPGNKLMKMSGTSMAAPHVAGAVARIIAEFGRDFNGDGVRDAQDVYLIRQTLIDRAEPQSEWNGSGDAKDPDINHEGLLQVL
jgi:subtilisin